MMINYYYTRTLCTWTLQNGLQLLPAAQLPLPRIHESAACASCSRLKASSANGLRFLSGWSLSASLWNALFTWARLAPAPTPST